MSKVIETLEWETRNKKNCIENREDELRAHLSAVCRIQSEIEQLRKERREIEDAIALIQKHTEAK